MLRTSMFWALAVASFTAAAAGPRPARSRAAAPGVSAEVTRATAADPLARYWTQPGSEAGPGPGRARMTIPAGVR